MQIYVQDHHSVIAKDRVSLMEISLSPHHCSHVTVSWCSIARYLGANWPRATQDDTPRFAEVFKPDLPLLGRNTLCHICSWHSCLFKAFISLLSTHCSLTPLTERHLCFWVSISFPFPRSSSVPGSFVVPLNPASSKTPQHTNKRDGNWSIGNYRLYLVFCTNSCWQNSSWLARKVHISVTT